jgi:hypothetical protein
MTHDERIEAMARAVCEQFYGTSYEWWYRMAESALAAAGVEEMIREAIGAYRGMLNDALSVDLENGVKWLSQRAAESFGRDYPELCRALEADSEDDIVREVMGK